MNIQSGDFLQRVIWEHEMSSTLNQIPNSKGDLNFIRALYRDSAKYHPLFEQAVSKQPTLDALNKGDEVYFNLFNSSDVTVTSANFSCAATTNAGYLERSKITVTPYKAEFLINEANLANIESESSSGKQWLFTQLEEAAKRIDIEEQNGLFSDVNAQSSPVYFGTHPFAGSTVTVNGTVNDRYLYFFNSLTTDIMKNKFTELQRTKGYIFLGDAGLNDLTGRMAAHGKYNDQDAYANYINNGIEAIPSYVVSSIPGASVSGYLLPKGAVAVTSWVRPVQDMLSESAQDNRLGRKFVRYPISLGGNSYELQLDISCDDSDPSVDARQVVGVQLKKTSVRAFSVARADNHTGIQRYALTANL